MVNFLIFKFLSQKPDRQKTFGEDLKCAVFHRLILTAKFVKNFSFVKIFKNVDVNFLITKHMGQSIQADLTLPNF